MPPFSAFRHDRSPLRAALGAAPARRPVNLLTGQPLKSSLPRGAETAGTDQDTELDAETRQANDRLVRQITRRTSFNDLLPILDKALQENPRQAGLEIEDLVTQLAAHSPEQARQLAEALPRLGTVTQSGLPPIPAQRPAERFAPPPKTEAENSFVSSPRKPEVIDFPLVLIPDYKNSFSGVIDHWEDFKTAVERFPGMTPATRRALLETFAAEGGLAPDGVRVTGIDASTYEAIRKRGLSPGFEGYIAPKDLTNEQRIRVLRTFMNLPEYFGGSGVGGIQELESLNDHEAAAVLFDTLLRHGSRAGSEIIQKAMNRLLTEPVKVDETFGSRTFAAFKRLIEDPADRLRLFEHIADGRIKDRPDEIARAGHFKFTPPMP